MSRDAWGDTDEDELIDAMAYPVAAALEEVRDEIAARIRTMTDELHRASFRSLSVDLLQVRIRELRSLHAYVEGKMQDCKQ